MSTGSVFALANSVFRSKDSGLTWSLADNGLPGSTIATLGANSTTVFAATIGSGVYRSIDDGTTWTSANSGLTVNYTKTFANKGDTVFAGNYRGIFATTDDGLLWQDINAGLSQIDVLSIVVNNEYVWMGTDQQSVWRRPFSEILTSMNNLIIELPSEFRLYQNYPNPFNPITIIEYELRIRSAVTIIIYDINGREIKTLVNQNQIAGVHSVTFDASGLASGIYIYKIKAGSFEQSRKMVLLR